MAIEDYEAELEQIDRELEDVNSVIALLSTAGAGIEADMRLEFADVRERLLNARTKTLEQMDAIRRASRH